MQPKVINDLKVERDESGLLGQFAESSRGSRRLLAMMMMIVTSPVDSVHLLGQFPESTELLAGDWVRAASTD